MIAALLLGQIADDEPAKSFAAAMSDRWSSLQTRSAELIEQTTLWLSQPTIQLLAATVLLAVGLYCFLPGTANPRWRIMGSLLGGAGVVLLLLQAEPIGFSLKALAFSLVSVITLTAAIGTVGSKSPLYSAIWFALTLFGVALLLLINGAQFLGIATVAVYAGAIVVTLLFVLMLAQPRGQTRYDRLSWGPFAKWTGCFAGAASCCLLVWAFMATPRPPTPDVATNPVLAPDHVATLGSTLFSRYLIAVEIAGVLLFAALVGAVAIASAQPKRIAGQIDRALENASTMGAIRHE